MTIDRPTREEVREFMEERKAGGADSKPFIGKWTGNYGKEIDGEGARMGNIARDEHNCRQCGRVIHPSEKMMMRMDKGYCFQATCIDCVEAANQGYEATMRLHKDHPELIPKLAKLYELARKGKFQQVEIDQLGITEDERAIFVEYGLIREE